MRWNSAVANRPLHRVGLYRHLGPGGARQPVSYHTTRSEMTTNASCLCIALLSGNVQGRATQHIAPIQYESNRRLFRPLYLG